MTFSHTINSGSNRILIVAVAAGGTGANVVTGATFNSVSMTQVPDAVAASLAGTFDDVKMYYLINPPVGTYNVVVSKDTTPGFLWAAASSYNGVNQSTPFLPTSGTGGNVTNTTQSLSRTTQYWDQWLVGYAQNVDATEVLSAGSNTSILPKVNIGDWSAMFDTNGNQGAPGVKTCTINRATSGKYAMVIVALVAEGTSATTTTTTPGPTTTTTTPAPTTTSAPLDTPGAIAFGEQTPTNGEIAVPWTTFKNDQDGAVEVTGDASWGKMKIELDEEGYSRVYNLNTNFKLFTLTTPEYGINSGTGTLQIRGSANPFARLAASPSWQTYSGIFNQNWKFVQIRVIKPSS